MNRLFVVVLCSSLPDPGLESGRCGIAAMIIIIYYKWLPHLLLIAVGDGGGGGGFHCRGLLSSALFSSSSSTCNDRSLMERNRIRTRNDEEYFWFSGRILRCVGSGEKYLSSGDCRYFVGGEHSREEENHHQWKAPLEIEITRRVEHTFSRNIYNLVMLAHPHGLEEEQGGR